jgi:hypothetical protein
MKATPNLNFTTISPTQSALDNFVQMIKNVYQNLVTVINGNIGFGDGTNSDNISGNWATVITPNVANTDFVITHNLGRVPVGYLVMIKSAAVDVYTGSAAATKTQITLRATVTSVTIKLFIF